MIVDDIGSKRAVAGLMGEILLLRERAEDTELSLAVAMVGGEEEEAVDGRFFCSLPLKPFQFPQRLPCVFWPVPPYRCPSIWKTGRSIFSQGGMSPGGGTSDVGETSPEDMNPVGLGA